jgi:hypothetical protein
LDPNCEESVAPTSQARRLTNEQYDHTVRDLLGVTTLGGEPPSSLLAPSSGDSFTELELEGYRLAAEAIAEQVVGDEALQARFLACTPNDAESPCWQDTILAFGRRAFRRPLTDAELNDFEQLVAAEAASSETVTVDELARALLVAFLTSPNFLVRYEVSETPDGKGNFVLSSHEVASRLSYLLWGSLPDTTLEQAADAGLLAEQDEIRAQAQRMLADPRARDQLLAFHRFYLRMGPESVWASREKDPATFPLFNERVRSAMIEETERFFDTVTFEGGSFQDLFSSSLGFVNSDTAPIYGLDPSAFGPELQPVTLDPGLRPGFLTRIGFLASFSNWDSTSPVLRGIFVSTFVLDLDIPSPEPVVDTFPPSGTYLTNREYYEALTSHQACVGCHGTYINPPGFVLEAYDAIGAWQTVDARSGPIDTVADVFIDGAPVRVADPAELMARIAASSDGKRAYVRRWLSFAHERPSVALDACTIARLSTRMTEQGYTILDLVVDLTQTEPFRLRAL